MQSIALPVPGGGVRPAVLALPARPPPHPGVVVIHDLTGFRADTRRWCGRFAQAGFAAIAPDLFDGGRPGCIVRVLLSLHRGTGEGLEVLAAARAHLAGLDHVDADRIGVIGFCMGGGFALLTGAQERYAVAAPFYGPVPRDRGRLGGLCPTIAHFGAQDWVYRPHADRLSAHLKALDIEHEVLVTEGAGHSFMNDHPDPIFAMGRLTPMRARYDAAASEAAWAAVLRFFRAHL